MASREKIERVRQAIMRYQELLDILRGQVEASQQTYNAMFDGFSDEERKTLKEKDLQWRLAEQIEGDLDDLKEAVGGIRFNIYNMEKEFAQLFNILVETESDE